MFQGWNLVAPLAAFLIGLCALRIVRGIALAVGFVDNPDRWRKLHEAPIPLGGGLAVWLATWSGWGISRLFGPPGAATLGDDLGFVIALAVASLVVLGLGVIDDRYGMTARPKLAGQLVAALVLAGAGLRIDALSGFGLEIKLGIFAVPIAMGWVVLVINAFNLIDGMDGFCGSLSLVAALGVAFVGFRTGHVTDAILALALAGALAAFLKDNLPPARVYLGDAGSMTLGLLFSALSLRACSHAPSAVIAFPTLLALLTLPLLDVVTAVARRGLAGRSIFSPDRGHLHHRLRGRLGNTVAALAAAVGLAALGAGGAALAAAYRLGDQVPSLAVVICVGLLMGTNTFGGSESRLLLFRIQSVLAPRLGRGDDRRRAVSRECRLHGIRAWAEVWDALVGEVEGCAVWRMELAIDIAAAGEVYHGFWSLPTSAMHGPNWSIVHTLHAAGVPAGVLRVAGGVDGCGSPYLDKVEKLVRLLEAQLVSADAPVSAAAAQSLSNVNLSVNSAGHLA